MLRSTSTSASTSSPSSCSTPNLLHDELVSFINQIGSMKKDLSSNAAAAAAGGGGDGEMAISIDTCVAELSLVLLFRKDSKVYSYRIISYHFISFHIAYII